MPKRKFAPTTKPKTRSAVVGRSDQLAVRPPSGVYAASTGLPSPAPLDRRRRSSHNSVRVQENTQSYHLRAQSTTARLSAGRGFHAKLAQHRETADNTARHPVIDGDRGSKACRGGEDLGTTQSWSRCSVALEAYMQGCPGFGANGRAVRQNDLSAHRSGRPVISRRSRLTPKREPFSGGLVLRSCSF